MPQLDKVVYMYEYLMLLLVLCLGFILIWVLLPLVLVNLFIRKRLTKSGLVCFKFANLVLINFNTKLGLNIVKIGSSKLYEYLFVLMSFRSTINFNTQKLIVFQWVDCYYIFVNLLNDVTHVGSEN